MATLQVLIPAEAIHARVSALGAQIDAECGPGPIFLIGILKGSCIFLADLARAIRTPVRLDFIAASSYGAGKSTSGQVRLVKDLDSSIEGRDVIVVEDIVDTGVTLTYLLQLLAQRKPKSLRVATLLDKPERRLREVHVDYVGFAIQDQFVVGYGLDYAQDYRNLPDVCVLVDETAG
ncbi:MAG: hypoxanthine phosphoribosyltransferase [Acidobacteriota bacterium]